MPVKRAATVTVLIATLLLISGCQSEAFKHVMSSFLPSKQAKQQDIVPMVYPAKAELGKTMDIAIVRSDRYQIRVDNRTTRKLENVTLYLNQQYGLVVEDLPIGQTVTLNLLNFVNEHAERYPTGSFLEPEKSKVIVLVDLLSGGKIHKLTVRLEEDWQRAQ